MALSKPVIDIDRIEAFDATIGTTIYYNIIGGALPNRNRITVIDTQGNICYQSNWVATFNNYCIIPANASDSGRALTNGNTYFVYIEVGDDNDVSPQSNQVQIYCYTTPVFEFVDAPSSVPSSTYNFKAKYFQAENELLDTYIFTLYNIENVVIATSGIQYASQLLPTLGIYTLSYTFEGLLDGQTFKIGLQGVTVNKTKLSITPQQFIVNYDQKRTLGTITLTNNCKTGIVDVQSSIDVHNGTAISPIAYVNDSEADLRQNDVYWRDVDTDDEFTIRVLFRAPKLTQYGAIVILNAQTNTDAPYFHVTYRYNTTTMANSCLLTDDTTSPTTLINSNILYGKPNDLTKFVLQVRKHNNQWSVQLGVFEQPTPTLYMDDNSNVYVSYVGDVEPPIQYSIDEDDDVAELTAEYDDAILKPIFDYDKNNGDIKITL